MRKAPKKSKITKMEPMYIEVDSMAADLLGISIPKIQYRLSGYVELDKVFDGDVIPLPAVLIRFLTHGELMIMCAIMEEILRTGKCLMPVAEMNKRTGKSPDMIRNSLYRLRRFGLLKQAKRGRKGGVISEINFNAVQRLYDLTKGEDPGIYARIRKSVRKTDLFKLNKEDVLKAYDNIVLPPDHDVEEEEEYN